ncbi:hypothetical protein OL229_05025 [Neisseriaceae bacterium JH1-16]|nr:hypothetical protein [Neisseriaceae bacterium JH1-16]
MSSRTTYLSRLIGLYLLLFSLSMFAHKQATVEVMTALVNNPPLLFMTGIILCPIGLAMILGHNVWTGGARPVIVTLIGWATLLKGLLCLFVPPAMAPILLLGGMHYASLYYLYACMALILGLYLSIGTDRRHDTR